MREISDIAAQVQALNSRSNKSKQRSENVTKNDVTSAGDWVYFDSPHELINRSVSSSDASWLDSGSAKYIPSNAKRAILFCYVDGTSDGTGLNKVEAKAKNVERKILAANEEGAGSAPAPCCEVQVPVFGGRFDYKATHNGGSGNFSFVIELVGYVR